MKFSMKSQLHVASHAARMKLRCVSRFHSIFSPMATEYCSWGEQVLSLTKENEKDVDRNMVACFANTRKNGGIGMKVEETVLMVEGS